MTEMTDLTSWCFSERERLHERLDALKDGRFCVKERLGTDWTDMTIEAIDEIEHSIEALDHLLMRYGRGYYDNSHHPMHTM
ncbi:hypothetical protein GCM10007874_03240 [Labrys miyagiensis]|uniref:Uncharacterized protein n=1 Tax=Labrys miyagiensis TaxID=346912 RepID=A0ABQ6CF55_9HYPH|nr:hypothetical protein [Labrys miyagiensis]GLS17309.1 hypothetical protein GCM10007874_03240 [Labrys miyagiensis]